MKKRHKEVKFFQKRLLQNYGEDWTVIPNTDLVKEEPHCSNMIVKTEKIKEEKLDGWVLNNIFVSKIEYIKNYVCFVF